MWILSGWFDSMFGKWKALILSLITGVLIGLSMLALCGCCIIPCIRGLIMRMIDKSVSRQMVQLGLDSNLLLAPDVFEDSYDNDD